MQGRIGDPMIPGAPRSEPPSPILSKTSFQNDSSFMSSQTRGGDCLMNFLRLPEYSDSLSLFGPAISDGGFNLHRYLFEIDLHALNHSILGDPTHLLCLGLRGFKHQFIMH